MTYNSRTRLTGLNGQEKLPQEVLRSMILVISEDILQTICQETKFLQRQFL